MRINFIGWLRRQRDKWRHRGNIRGWCCACGGVVLLYPQNHCADPETGEVECGDCLGWTKEPK